MAKLPYVNMAKVKAHAKENGITFKWFCDQFGKDRGYLTNVGNGKDRLSSEELAFIAEKLGVSEAYLLDETDDPTPTSGKRYSDDIDNLSDSEVRQRFREIIDETPEEELEMLLYMLEAAIAADKKRKENKA